MDLLEIGTALREARERKGWTLNDVEGRIKVAQPMLAALESGDKNCFPHPVYAKGFIRSYAALLDLDVAELCADFSREYPVPTDTEYPEEDMPHITVKIHRTDHPSWLRLVLLAVVVLGAGAALWYGYTIFGRTKSLHLVEDVVSEQTNGSASSHDALHGAKQPGEETDNASALTQMAEVQASNEETANASAPAEHSEAVQAPAQAPVHEDAGAAPGRPSDAALADSPGTGDGNATQIVVPVAPDQDTSSIAATPADQPEISPSQPVVQGESHAPDSAPHMPGAGADSERILVITAHAATWLQARPDGKSMDYFLRKGETATIVFAQSLSIKFGNAGGVLMTLDGQPYPFDAKLGEVRTLVIQ